MRVRRPGYQPQQHPQGYGYSPQQQMPQGHGYMPEYQQQQAGHGQEQQYPPPYGMPVTGYPAAAGQYPPAYPDSDKPGPSAQYYRQ